MSDAEITETGVFKWEWQKEIARLRAENASLGETLATLELVNHKQRAALEEVKESIYALMPDGWSDAPYVISVIDCALKETK